MIKRRIVRNSIFIAAIIFYMIAVFSSSEGLKKGESAPDFPLSYQGQQYSSLYALSSYLYIHFWATWCPECKRELPQLISKSKWLHDQGITQIMVAVQDDPVAVEKVKSVFPDYVIFVDDISGQIADNYKVDGIPSTVLVLPEKTVYHHYSGTMDLNNESILEDIKTFSLPEHSGSTR